MNGTFEKIKDVTNDYFTDESPDLLNTHLLQMGEGKVKRN